MIANTFIKRPNTAIVVAIVLILLGVLSIFNLPISQYPDISPPSVVVSGAYTGADAQTVEQTVTTPIETQINGSPGMSYIQSSSTNDGRTSITVHYNIGTNPDIATLDVQNRVGIATPQLPDLVKRLGITVRKRSSSILMLVGIYSPNSTHNISFLDNYTNIYIRDALLRVNGVGDIFSRANDFSMRIWLHPDKLAELALTPGEVIAALQEQNLQVAAGSVGVPPQQMQQVFEYTLLTNSKLSTEEEFQNIIVRTRPDDGSVVYLKDVARVQLGQFNYGGTSYVDNKPASFLMIYQAPGSNALDVYNGVMDAMKELKASFPTDVDYIIPFEAVSVVKVSIQEVLITIIIALLLVTLVVYLFLQSVRATIIPILAIPVSIIGTFALFGPLGFTINTLTLFGFVLAIGIVVDDAIIVVEATQRYIDEHKLSPKEAATKAMEDISGPVIAIALILAAVFVPVGLIPGIVGKLYQQFAITIAISVIISAFVALSLTPALCSIMLKPTSDKPPKGITKWFARFNAWFERITKLYTGGVKRAIKASPYILILLLCITLGAGLLFETKSTGFIPEEDGGQLIVTYQLAEGASTSRSMGAMKKIMEVVRETKGIKHFGAINGFNAISGAIKANSGTLFVQLDDWDLRKEKSLQINAITSTLQQQFAKIEEATIITIAPPAISGLGATAGFTFELQQRESTDDIKEFEQVVQLFVIEANKQPELNRTFTFFSAQTPAYVVTVDREKCKMMGILLSDVYGIMQTYLGSAYVNDFTLYGRNFRVVVQADTVYRSNIDELLKYRVANSRHEMVPLSTLLTISTTQSASAITHYNIFRSAEINGSAAQGYSSGQAIEALRRVAAQTLPEGYGYEFSGLSREEIDAGSTSIIVFCLSILFVFLFLVALYESWAVPFSVIMAVPIGVFGAILTLTFFKYISNNIYAQIGLITLIGLAAKNAILIVEYAKQRTDNNMPLIPATLEAVKLRLRPIIMTSMAFLLGVLPLAFAEGAGAAARSTIGWTVLGGMFAATSLAIFIVPVLFVVIMKLAYGKKMKKESEA